MIDPIWITHSGSPAQGDLRPPPGAVLPSSYPPGSQFVQDRRRISGGGDPGKLGLDPLSWAQLDRPRTPRTFGGVFRRGRGRPGPAPPRSPGNASCPRITLSASSPSGKPTGSGTGRSAWAISSP